MSEDRRHTEVAPRSGNTGPGSEGTASVAADTPPPILDLPTAVPPTVLGGYRVLRCIGRGGMGEVYAAFDPALHREVAIKVMRGALAEQPEALERFLREARAAAALQHDHVAPIYHVGEAGGSPFLVMPLLTGETLHARLRRSGPLTPAEVIRLGRETALGLAAAHEKGLVHRDIKPSNLWLEPVPGGFRVKILDFGLVRWAGGDRPTVPGLSPGTPGYMSPEQAAGDAIVDARTDLFSLGAVLYEAATGEPAFGAAGPTELMRGSPPVAELPPTIPRPLGDYIRRLLARDRNARPAGAAAVAEDLAHLAVPGEPKRCRRAGPAWNGMAAAGLAVIAIAVWQGTRKPHAGSTGPTPGAPAAPVHYTGSVDILVERETAPGNRAQLVRLDDPAALPLRPGDLFRIEAHVDPPAYLYLIWVDPGKDVTPVYPWDPAPGRGWPSRPSGEDEHPVPGLSLPPEPDKRYPAPATNAGVATMVLLASPNPLDAPDEAIRRWFEELPELPVAAGGEHAAVWFDNFVEVRAPGRTRSGFARVESADPFARWQGRLKKAVGTTVSFQTAVSFARGDAPGKQP